MTLSVKSIKEVPPGVQLRIADQLECMLGGMDPQDALEISVGASLCAFSAEIDGDLVAYWGYAPLSLTSDRAMVWMLSCPGADDHKLALGRVSRKLMNELLTRYSALIVTVDPRHQVAMTWLTFLGFRPLQACGPFIQLIIERGLGWEH